MKFCIDNHVPGSGDCNDSEREMRSPYEALPPEIWDELERANARDMQEYERNLEA